MIRTRFAPSPNGPLHLGHAFAAIVAHDLARARGGAFLLRIEDIDAARSRAEMVPEILADLAWLGLGWDDAPVFQSARLDSYARAGERLKAIGLLYPCHCTRAQVAAAAREAGPDGPVYPGTCRGRRGSGEGASWRLDMAAAIERAGPLDVARRAGGGAARPARKVRRRRAAAQGSAGELPPRRDARRCGGRGHAGDARPRPVPSEPRPPAAAGAARSAGAGSGITMACWSSRTPRVIGANSPSAAGPRRSATCGARGRTGRLSPMRCGPIASRLEFRSPSA